MAEKKYDDHKCFVLSAAGYEEITYSELCRRCQKIKVMKANILFHCMECCWR